jgi:hypothetical protein
VRGGLEVQRNLAVLELEGSRVCQNSVTTLIEYWRATLIAGYLMIGIMSVISTITSFLNLYLAGNEMVAGLSSSAEEMQTLIFILDHSHRCLVLDESQQLDAIISNTHLREYDSPLERRAM